MSRGPAVRGVATASVVAFLVAASAASAASVTVTRQDDPLGSGDCTGADTSCSLRQAVAEAPAGSTIVIPSAANPYQLNGGDPLDINTSLTLSGAGARTTVIKQGSGSVNVITIASGVTATIQGVTITGGNGTNGTGGGISSSGNLTLVDTAVTQNQVSGYTFFDGMFANEFPGTGGGINASGGSLAVIRSSITANSASVGAGLNAYGGGIYSLAPVTITDSTIANNSADGGSTTGQGGGIYMGADALAQLHMANVTLASNTASGTPSAQGGNLYLVQADAGYTVKNSIIANGTGASGSENCFGTSGQLTSQGFNLENLNQCSLSGPGDKTSTSAGLGALQSNGGSTDTIGLLAGSPAINAGNPSGCTDPANAPITTDQRGVTRPQGARCDIGAFEFRVPKISGQPKISGRPALGQHLSCLLPAVQSADGPAIKTVNWLRDGVVVGAGGVYTVKAADQGHALRCRLVATSAGGSASAVSLAVTVRAPPSVRITLVDISGHRATFKFTTQRATGTRCALAKGSNAPRFSACTSPKRYSKLAKGRYTFAVRAVGPGGESAPAEQSFRIG